MIPILSLERERGACAVKTCSGGTVLLKALVTLYMHVAGAVFDTKLRRAIQMVLLPPACMLESVALYWRFHSLPMKVLQRRYRCLAFHIPLTVSFALLSIRKDNLCQLKQAAHPEVPTHTAVFNTVTDISGIERHVIPSAS